MFFQDCTIFDEDIWEPTLDRDLSFGCPQELDGWIKTLNAKKERVMMKDEEETK